MTTSYAPRFDFIIVKPRHGVARAEIEISLIKTMGVKPEKVQQLLNHLAEKGPVLVEKAVGTAKLEELKQKWEAAGLETTANEVLTIVEERPTFTCPACGHQQEKKGQMEQCEKCGVFTHKFIEEQKKREAIQQEIDRLAKMRAFAQQQEVNASKERREKEEIENIRKKIEGKKGLGGIFTAGRPIGPVTEGLVAVAVLGVVLALGWFAREAISPSGTSADVVARQQGANVTQQRVSPWATDKTIKELFPAGDKDDELREQMLAAVVGNAEVKGALAEGGGAAGLSEAARSIAGGGNAEQIERALAILMQSARSIKDDKQRAEKVSAVANAQFEMFTNEARQKVAMGDRRAAEKAFSKAISAATDITTKPEAVVARSSVAKARAEAGDYGGAALIFLDAIKTVEEISDPRERAIALAGVAKSLAEASNDVGGAAERAFENAFQAAAALPARGDKAAAMDAVLQRRVEAAGNVAGYLLTTAGGADAARPALEQAAKDAEQMTDPLQKARALGVLARLSAEAYGGGEAVDAILGKIVRLREAAPQQRELMQAAAALAKAESLAAAAKFHAAKGEKLQAKQGFLQALNAVGGIAANSPDPVLKSEIAKQRFEALSVVARYMQAAGDTQAAARVFALAMENAGGK